MADHDQFKLTLKVRLDIARKLVQTHGLTQTFALTLVNDTLRHLRESHGVKGNANA